MSELKNAVRMIYDRNIKIHKYWCDECEAYSFADGELLVCCGSKKKTAAKVTDEHAVNKSIRKRILKDVKVFERDNYKCIYCGKDLSYVEFYTTKMSKKIKRLIPTIDHLVPYSFALTDNRENLVTACNLCNNIKGSHVFSSIAEAQLYIRKRLKKLGVEYASRKYQEALL